MLRALLDYKVLQVLLVLKVRLEQRVLLEHLEAVPIKLLSVMGLVVLKLNG